MLDQEMLAQIATYTEKINRKITIRVSNKDHESKADLMGMLEGIASTSDKIDLKQEDLPYRSGVSFDICIGDKPTGIIFSGIPGGHEFTSLILAILQSGGVPLKLDEGVQKLIKAYNTEMNFETVVSLDCHNCPDVVQALNQMCLLNDNITHEMIDGGLFPDLVSERKIMGVPTIFQGNKLFSSGKADISDILEKINEVIPASSITQDIESSSEVFDVAIIGGGPAGVSAAIYSARKGLNVLMIADRVGGQVKDTMGIENMISIKSTTGPELVNSMEDHLNSYNVKIRKNLRVSSIIDGDIKEIELNTQEKIKTKTIIIATGAKWRELGVPGEKENIGNGVAYCPHCDGPFFKGKDVIVVGGGNSGIEAALDLSGIVKSVTVLEFLPDLKADSVLIDKVNETSNISVMTQIQSKEIKTENGKVSGLEYVDRNSGETKFINTDGIFIQIGLIPNSEFVKGVLETNKYGEIIIDDKCRTNISGIYACGDVTTVPYKQIVISMGEGAKAALTAFEYILMNSKKAA
ncbi:MAG: alkyl hydroperoxide reductase subunit F [Leptospiraceae bacterium]|nr:alkyl hydroperoxide reductase subunit F [Leptospiraceae bacterium]